MNTRPAELHILQSGCGQEIVRCDFNKLALTPVWSIAPAPFEVLDFFDQPLQTSGRLLIRTGDELILLSATGVPLRQASRRPDEFLSDFDDGPVKAALGGLSGLRRFLSRGSGVLGQSEFALLDDQGKTRARLYVLELVGNESDAGADVAVVEGLRGYEKAFRRLSDCVAGLRDEEAGDLSTVYARLFPGIEDYTAKPKILMADTEAAFDIANKIIAAYLTVARKNEPGIIADSDTEFLHDYRIALRKIRSVVSLFKGIYSDEETHRLKAEFAALMAPTGRLRDLDVYLTERQRYYDFLPNSLHDGLTVMFDMFENERTETRKTLAIWLQGDEYRLQIAELAGTFDSPAQIAPGSEAKRDAMEYARSLIWKRYRRVCRTAAAIGDDTGDEEVHELRIDCKKLRYLMEFFAPLFPARRLKGLLRPLKALQDNLGLFNDYSVQQATLERFLAGLDPRHRKRNIKVAQSIGALITILNQRQRQERGKIVASFAHFNSAAVQKEFSGIFRTKGSKA